MSKPRELWILKTPAGEMIEYDEPMGMDWKLCSKTLFIEKAAADKLAEALELVVNLKTDQVLEMRLDNREVTAALAIQSILKQALKECRGS